MYYAKLITDSSLDAFKVEIYSIDPDVKVKTFYALSLYEVKKFLKRYFKPAHGRTKSEIIEEYK